MGCLEVKVLIATTALVATAKGSDVMRVSVSEPYLLTADVSHAVRLRAATILGERPQAKVGIVCSVPEEMAIQFAKDKLVWEGETNKEGVVIYNTLISTGEWSLEEITIEELL